MLALEARGLEKRFAELVAVDGISLDVPLGGCFGFLGPNGQDDDDQDDHMRLAADRR